MNTLKRVIVGICFALVGIGVVAAGTAIGNNGLKGQLDKWKDEITNKINPDKDNSTSTSTSTSTKAAKQLVVGGDYFKN